MRPAKPLRRVCLTPTVSGIGGMVSFQAKISAGLVARGIEVSHDPSEGCDAILVIGGTRQLNGLRRAARSGIPVVQRLDGMNWLHRRRRTGLRHWIRAELGNRLLAAIRNQIATTIVYQSHFVQDWWQGQYGAGPKSTVIHNGVDLELFSPNGPERPPAEQYRILMVEGSLLGGYELGLESALGLAAGLQASLSKPLEVAIAGRVDAAQKAKWSRGEIKIEWLGVVPNDNIPAFNRGAHLLYSADINAACPNSVIEALASGLPVLAFDTGALKELVPPTAGVLAPYGGDPWKLDPPNINGLVGAAGEILQKESGFRVGARAHAEEVFGLDKMVDSYIGALSG